jgi:hypothetical protein
MLQFLADWLQRNPDRLRASLEDFAAIPPWPPAGCAGGVQGGGGSAELANLEGVDVLLEGNGFAAVHGPHVGHLHDDRFSGTLVLPPVAPERHDGLTVGDELVGHRGHR